MATPEQVKKHWTNIKTRTGAGSNSALKVGEAIVDLISEKLSNTSGWSPVLAVTKDNNREVLQIKDWTGGTDTKPSTGYLGATGVVTNITQAVNIKGSNGANGKDGYKLGFKISTYDSPGYDLFNCDIRIEMNEDLGVKIAEVYEELGVTQFYLAPGSYSVLSDLPAECNIIGSGKYNTRLTSGMGLLAAEKVFFSNLSLNYFKITGVTSIENCLCNDVEIIGTSMVKIKNNDIVNEFKIIEGSSFLHITGNCFGDANCQIGDEVYGSSENLFSYNILHNSRIDMHINNSFITYNSIMNNSSLMCSSNSNYFNFNTN